ncbi:hypothetical protein FBEOM_11414 [Fusarium beomiforme]|uniref:F-box domain-containing protein n=1 Tax=Fusarium beomiforme TaxID=44412 RepID=A0A9P5AB49_9HYPO|nr:hypothetical protein FBEOM_11414 [Fusarium beomiforme]
MPLESLAPELVSLILQNVESRDLHNLIAASPACFRIFSQTPQLILSSVIGNAIPIETLKHFLAVLQAPTPATNNHVSRFLDRYFDASSSFDFPTTRGDLISLYQVYNRVNYLITRYLRQMKELGFDETILVPSSSESIRLQRSFLRFEVYCRVFPADDTRPWENPSPNHQFSAVEQFGLFISRLSPWEVEEMACIHLYSYLLIGEYIDRLEDNTGPESETKGEEDENDKSDTLRDFTALDLTKLVLFSKDGRYRSPDSISYMTSLGLQFTCNLDASESRRSELIRSNSPFYRDFLPEALNHSPLWPPEHQYNEFSMEETSIDDDPSAENLGYCVFRKNRDRGHIYIAITHQGSYYSTLRQLGYVFWDSDRIRSSEISARLEAAGAMTVDELYKRFDRRTRKGVEARLEGLKLPREQFDKIEREFGYIRRPLPEGWD